MRWPPGDVAQTRVARGVKITGQLRTILAKKNEIVLFDGTLGRTAGQQITLAFIHTHAHKRTTLRETTGMDMRGGYLLAGDDAHTLSALWLGVGVGLVVGAVFVRVAALLVVLGGPQREVVAEQLRGELGSELGLGLG